MFLALAKQVTITNNGTHKTPELVLTEMEGGGGGYNIDLVPGDDHDEELESEE